MIEGFRGDVFDRWFAISWHRFGSVGLGCLFVSVLCVCLLFACRLSVLFLANLAFLSFAFWLTCSVTGNSLAFGFLQEDRPGGMLFLRSSGSVLAFLVSGSLVCRARWDWAWGWGFPMRIAAFFLMKTVVSLLRSRSFPLVGLGPIGRCLCGH